MGKSKEEECLGSTEPSVPIQDIVRSPTNERAWTGTTAYGGMVGKRAAFSALIVSVRPRPEGGGL